MTTTHNFLDLESKRRSIYALGQNVELGQEELVDLIQSAIKHAPTAFNNQTVRAVILFGERKNKLWDLTEAALKPLVPDAAAFENTVARLNGFRGGFGTVLFFSDTDVIKSFEENVPLYAENFYDWSEQGHGIAEYATWLALVENGLGANLQHYNPVIDAAVAAEFNVPSNWRLRAQLNFGSVEAPAGEKEFLPDADRFKVFK